MEDNRQYIILKSTITHLESEINNWMAKGYDPYGYTSHYKNDVYMQSMIKKSKSTLKKA